MELGRIGGGKRLLRSRSNSSSSSSSSIFLSRYIAAEPWLGAIALLDLHLANMPVANIGGPVGPSTFDKRVSSSVAVVHAPGTN